jgi:hypothetical protein
MVKQSRKQRKSRSQSRKQKRQSRRSQRGGAAPFDAPYEALTGASRDAAQVAPLDRYISDLPGLIPKQGGGHYRQRNGNGPSENDFININLTQTPASASVVPAANAIKVGENILVGGSAPFGDPYTYKLNGGRRQRRRRSLRNRRQRNQRGGNAPFDAPYSLGYKLPGVNEQFASEGSVNSLYSQNRGAQGY